MILDKNLAVGHTVVESSTIKIFMKLLLEVCLLQSNISYTMFCVSVAFWNLIDHRTIYSDERTWKMGDS